MKTLLIVLGILLVLFTFIALVRIKIFLAFSEEERKVTLSILWMNFALYPPTEKKKKKKDREQKAEKGEEETEQQKPKTKLDVKDIFRKISVVSDLVKQVLSLVWHKLFKKIELIDPYIRVNISEEDAYDTAMRYAAASGIIYTMLGLLADTLTVKNAKVLVTPDFLPDRFFYEFRTQISLRIGQAIVATFSLLWLAFCNRKTIKNEFFKGEEI